MKNKKAFQIASTGLMAALSYVVFTFLQIKITLPGGDATSIHLGNAVCVLGALLLGGLYGGLGGAIGMTIGDLLDPVYVVYAPKTFILKDVRQDRGREQTRGRRSPRQEDGCPGQRGMLLAKAAFWDHGDTKKAAPKGRLCCAGSSRQAGRQPCRSIFFRLRHSGRPVRHRAHRSGQPDHPGCGR